MGLHTRVHCAPWSLPHTTDTHTHIHTPVAEESIMISIESMINAQHNMRPAKSTNKQQDTCTTSVNIMAIIIKMRIK